MTITAITTHATPPNCAAQSDVRLSRNAVAFFDAGLDLVYSAVFLYMMSNNGLIGGAFPYKPMEVVSLFWPTAHIVFVCRAIEEAAVDLQARKKRASAAPNNQRRNTSRTVMALSGRVEPLSRWGSVRFVLVAGSIVAAVLLLRCGDRYPLGTIPGSCAPCVCENGVLLNCRYHAEISDPVLWINGRGVTEVDVDAFKHNGVLSSRTT